VAGLGGRPVTRRSLRGLFDDVLADRLDPGRLHFLDLNTGLVERELARMRTPRPGPHAESMLRDLGSVGAESH
jgi:pyruvate ferredoxin oxidoreductase alpha subunit